MSAAPAAAEAAKLYLQQKEVPALFEALMTGIICNKPDDVLAYMESCVAHIRASGPGSKVAWDMFIDKPPSTPSKSSARLTPAAAETPAEPSPPGSRPSSDQRKSKSPTPSRPASVMMAAKNSHIPAVPIVLLMGGPGGDKTRHAARVCQDFRNNDMGVVQICTPDLVKSGIARYKDRYKDWKEASKKYAAGELIAGHLVVALVKAEMGKHQDAKAFFLEGYPRDMEQVVEFEKELGKISNVIIIDYNEQSLIGQMMSKGLTEKVAQRRIAVFKGHTLPVAKYYDDKNLLHLIPGEQKPDAVCEQMREIIEKSMSVGAASDPPAGELERVAESAAESPLAQQEGDHDEAAVEQEEVEKSEVADSGAPPEENQDEAQQEAIAPPPAQEEEEEDEDDSDIPRGLPNDAPVILVIGAPGSQKTEYCKRIVKKYEGFTHLSMGELLRKEIDENPDDEKLTRLKGAMERGELLPMPVCRRIMHKAIHETQKSWGYVLEAYPRTEQQAADFERLVERIDLVMLIDCTEKKCLETLKARAEETAERWDDTPAAAEQRIKQFKQRTLPMLKYFDEKSKLKVVEGDHSLDDVFSEVSAIIDSALFIPQDTSNADGNSLESSKGSK